MNPILMWIANNKLASIIGAVALMLFVALGIQTMKVNYLSSKIEILENKLEANEIAFENLLAKSKSQEAEIEKSKRRIKSIFRQYEDYIKDLKGAEVPVQCEEAVTWGSTQMNTIIGGE